MTGRGVGKPRLPADPDPSPMPMELPEIEEAKKRVRKRARGRGGRESTRLAGRMMLERNDTSILKTTTG